MLLTVLSRWLMVGLSVAWAYEEIQVMEGRPSPEK